MNRPRTRRDGLPYRVYERKGVRSYSIGYKTPEGRRKFRLTCSIKDKPRIAELRSEAIRRAAQKELGAPDKNSVDALITAWLKWQDELPENSEEKRAKSTHDENRDDAEKE